jgi:transcription elongation factor GreA
MDESTSTGEAITTEGLDALRAEVEDLEGRGRNEMAERIKAARELGDLKENAEYHIAKEDQAHLETQISRLRERLRKAVVTEVAADDGDDAFTFGRTAEVLDESSGKVQTLTLVGRAESDLGKGKLSAESPVGRALRDQPVGETVVIETPRGKKNYRIQKLVS